MYICETEDEVRFVFENCSLPNGDVDDIFINITRFRENNILYIFDEGDEFTLCFPKTCLNCGHVCFNNKDIKQVYVKHLIRQKKLERICSE